MEYVLRMLYQPNFGMKKLFFNLKALFLHICDHFIPHSRNDYHPHIFSQRMSILLASLLVTLKIFSIIVVSVGSVMPALSLGITSENIIGLTNQSRQTYGLPSLTENSTLTIAAQNKATDMAVNGYFSHNTPLGKTPWDFLKSSGYNYLSAGENLAVNFFEAESVETAWMNSPGHKANILNTDFEEIGVGVSQGQYQGRTATFVVQMFGVRAEQNVVLTKIPTPVQVFEVPKPELKIGIQGALEKPVARLVVNDYQKQKVANDIYNKEKNILAESFAEPLKIYDSKAWIEDGTLNMRVKTSNSAVKVLAKLGDTSVMFDPKDEVGLWESKISLNKFKGNTRQINVVAYDINQRDQIAPVVEVVLGTINNFQVLGASYFSENNEVGLNFAGLHKRIDPQSFSHRFYLIFTALLLSCLILAIGIKRHIQHVGAVANGSFVAILAILLWMT